MNYTLFFTLLLQSCLLNLLVAPASAAPNVIIFYVDDLGYGDLGAYGHPVVKSPNIDSLAEQGATFTQFYAPAPLCSPSRAGLLTGRTPYRTGIRSWIPEGQDIHIGSNEITLAHLLKMQGYNTAITGKMHLNGGAHMTTHPQAKDLGFDYRFVLPGGYVDSQLLEKQTQSPRSGPFYPDNFWKNGKPVGPTKHYSAELVANEAINFIGEQTGQTPFFLYVPFTEVHAPIASPPEYTAMYTPYITPYAQQHPDLYYRDFVSTPYRGAGEYYANITYMDAQLGRILKTLDEQHLRDNTIIIFSSDNGPVTREARKPWELNLAGETNGLRGRKDNLFEGGIRVPGIVVYPGITKHMQIDTPVTALDILPTLSEWIHFPLPADRELDGQSLLPLFTDQPFTRTQPLIWTIDMPNQDDPVNEWAIRIDDWKMILDRDEQPKFLFNLAHDPYEIANQLGKNAAVEKALLEAFKRYKQRIDQDAISAQRIQRL